MKLLYYLLPPVLAAVDIYLIQDVPMRRAELAPYVIVLCVFLIWFRAPIADLLLADEDDLKPAIAGWFVLVLALVISLVYRLNM